MNKSLLGLALSGLLVAASPAHALNVSIGGFAHGSEWVYTTLLPPNTNSFYEVDAGGFLVTVGGLGSFTAYCVELGQALSMNASPGDYSLVPGASYAFANPTANADLGKLFSAGHLVNNAVTEAAFQIAIWEIVYETTGLYNLQTGSSMATGGSATTSGALALAATWLSTLPNVGSAAVTVLTSPTGQDLVLASMVPEPSTDGLMLSGLMAVGFLAYRRSPRRS